jgi:triphosphatase
VPSERKIAETDRHYDALDLRPVERWLAALPTGSPDVDGPESVVATAQPTRRMIDSYLDTGDWRMAQAGFVVRTRRRGRQDDITLMSTRSPGSAGHRTHLDVSEELPDGGVAELGAEGPVGRRIHAVAGRQSVRPVLQVRTRRRPFALRVDGRDAGEIALDDTEIVVGNGQRPMLLRRVEFDIRPQWMDALRPILSQLRAACGLRPATLSKFEAGLLARGVVIPGPPDLGPTEISPDATLGDLAYAVIRRQLAVLRVKEPGTRLGEDPEELHEMRVATRRLRAALDLYSEVLPVRARGFRGEVGWMAEVLGTVRDLDVQLDAQAAMAEPGQEHLWADLTALLERERADARTALLESLDSVRWERLLKGMAAMVRQGPFRRSAASRVAAQVAVPDLIGMRHTAVVKAARRAKRSGEAADFHRLRIRAKRLRYSLEFSSELYGGQTARYTRQLAKLQNQLGLFQDAEVAANRLCDLATGEAHLPAATIFVMGGVAEQHRREMMRLLERLPAEVSRVRGREWDDLVAVMERDRDQALALGPLMLRTLRMLPEPYPSQSATADGAPEPTTVPPPVLVPAISQAAGGHSPA